MNTEARARAEFDRLTRAEVAEAVRNMKVLGFGDYEVAAACRLSVEMVRAILSERRERRESHGEKT